MTAGARLLCIICSAALLLGACATKPAPIPEQVEAPAVETPKEPVKEPAADAQVVAPEKPPDSTGFIATEDLYRKTFAEVQVVIEELTRIIAAGNYEQWVAYLTEQYIAVTGSERFLAEATTSGVLKKSGTVLKSLKDYFQNVVVRSRVQATLDDITFVDATHVKAITIIQDTPIILYYLVREDGRWKVGVLPTDDKP
jgi:hypothetical protein